MIGRHKFSSGVPDGANSALILPSDWNQDILLGHVMTNRTGGVLTAGDVVAIDSANNSSVVLADTVGARRQYVVLISAVPSSAAHAPGTTVADLATGIFLPMGVATVKVAGATTRGNYLRKSASTKALEDTGITVSIAPPGDAIATALSGVGGAGTVTAVFRGLPAAPTGEFNYIFNGDFEIWGSGVSAAPTGWALTGAGATVAKDTTNFRIGTASVAVTRSGTDCHISLSPQLEAVPGYGIKLFQGKTVTFGCWVRATVASRARLRIADSGTTTDSAYHSGSGAFEFLTVTKAVDAGTANLTVRLMVDNGDTTAQFDGAILVVGSSVSDFIPSGWRGRKAIIQFSSLVDADVAAGATVFMNCAGHSTTENHAATRVPFKGVARNLAAFADGAVGAGETYVYTLRDTQGVADTSLTSTTSNPGQSSDNFTNEVEFVKGRFISMKLVVSAGAAANRHSGAYEYEEIP